MRLLITLFFANIIFSLSIKSQIQFGVNAGGTISNLSGYSGSNEKSLIGFQTSAFGIITLGKSFIVHPSIGYYPKGNRLTHLTFSDQLGNNIGEGTMKFRYDYL